MRIDMVGPVFKRVVLATLLLLGMMGSSAFAVDLPVLPASVKAIKYPDIPFGISPNRAMVKFGLQKELRKGGVSWLTGEGDESRWATMMGVFYFYSNDLTADQKPDTYIDANGGIHKDLPRNIKGAAKMGVHYDFFMKSRLVVYQSTLSAFYQGERTRDATAVRANQKTDEDMKALIASISAQTRVAPKRDKKGVYKRGSSYEWDDGAMLITLKTPSWGAEGYILYVSKKELAAIEDYKRKAQAETDAAAGGS